MSQPPNQTPGSEEYRPDGEASSAGSAPQPEQQQPAAQSAQPAQPASSGVPSGQPAPLGTPAALPQGAAPAVPDADSTTPRKMPARTIAVIVGLVIILVAVLVWVGVHLRGGSDEGSAASDPTASSQTEESADANASAGSEESAASDDESADSQETQDLTTLKQGTDKITATLPSTVNKFGGISVGAEGTAGSRNEGVPEVGIYFDYLCSYCNMLEEKYADQLAELAEKGEVTLTYYPVSIFSQYDFSKAGPGVEMWFAEHRPDLYLNFHDAVMKEVTNPLFHSEKPIAPELTRYYDVAKEVGLSDDEVNSLKTAVESGQYNDLTQQLYEQFAANGFPGTPMIIINGKVYDGDWTQDDVISLVKNAGPAPAN